MFNKFKQYFASLPAAIRSIVVGVTAVALFLLVGFWGRQTFDLGPTKTITDMAGRQVTIQRDQKVAIGLHALPDTIIGNLAPDKQRTIQPVSLARIGIFPKEKQERLKSMTLINAFYKPTSTEAIIAAGPTVVVTLTKDPEMDKRSDELGVPTLALSKDTFKEIAGSWRVMGQVLDKESEANKIADYIDKESSALKEITSAQVYHPRAWVASGVSGETPANQTIMNEILHYAGAQTFWDFNERPAQASPTDEGLVVPIEEMIKFDPEYIFCGNDGIRKAIINDPRISGLSAVKNKRVFTMLRYSRLDTMQSIPGCRWVAGIMYPEAFRGSSTFEEYTSKYYKEVLNTDVEPTSPLLQELNT